MRRAGRDEAVAFGEKAVGVVPGKVIERLAAIGSRLLGCRPYGARIVLGAVASVGIAGDRGDPGHRLGGQREGQQKLDEYIRNQGRGIAQRLALLVESAEKGLNEAGQDVAQGVLEIAAEIARQVVRHELSINPNALLPVVRESLALLAADSKVATVRLHPKDLEVLEEPLAQEFGAAGVTWLGDPSLRPGNCLVEAAGTTVDGTLARRWSRAVAALGLELAWDSDAQEAGDAA